MGSTPGREDDSDIQPEIPRAKDIPAFEPKVQDGEPSPQQHTQGKSTTPKEGSDPELPSGPEIVVYAGEPLEDTASDGQIDDLVLNSLPKGPVAVQANLDPLKEKEFLIYSPDQPEREKVIEAEPLDHLSLEEKADSLPEIIHIPFEDAVAGSTLQGWEDQWISHASYDAKAWGKLEEPKIDFVYLCK